MNIHSGLFDAQEGRGAKKYVLRKKRTTYQFPIFAFEIFSKTPSIGGSFWDSPDIQENPGTPKGYKKISSGKYSQKVFHLFFIYR